MPRATRLSLKVETMLGIDVLDEAAVELCALADRLDIIVETTWNGIGIMAMPGDDPAELVAGYRRVLRHRQATTDRRGA